MKTRISAMLLLVAALGLPAPAEAHQRGHHGGGGWSGGVTISWGLPYGAAYAAVLSPAPGYYLPQPAYYPAGYFYPDCGHWHPQGYSHGGYAGYWQGGGHRHGHGYGYGRGAGHHGNHGHNRH